MKYTLSFLAVVSLRSLCITGTCDADSKSKNSRQLIKEKILCNYDTETRPVLKNNSPTKVNLIFNPISVEFIDESSTSPAYMKLTTFIRSSWEDENIHWSFAEKYEPMYLDIDPNSIWVPDIMQFNWAEEGISLENVDALFATYHGLVLSTKKVVLKGHCVPDYTNWPFDEHSCDFIIVSKQFFGNELDFELSGKGMFMNFFIPHPEWDLLDYSAKRNITIFRNSGLFAAAVTITLKVRRNASVLIASYVTPAFGMVLLSLAVFWLDPLNSQRLLVISVLVILQALFLQYLAFKIHSNGNTVPNIVRFYSGGLCLSTILFMQTIFLRCMIKWTSRPSWLQSLTNLILTNSALQFALLRDSDPKAAAVLLESGEDEGLTLVSKSEGGQQWKMFSEVIDTASYLIMLLIYIFLFLHFIK